MKFADLIVENGQRLGYGDTVVSGKPPIFSTNLEAASTAEIFRCVFNS